LSRALASFGNLSLQVDPRGTPFGGICHCHVPTPGAPLGESVPVMCRSRGAPLGECVAVTGRPQGGTPSGECAAVTGRPQSGTPSGESVSVMRSVHVRERISFNRLAQRPVAAGRLRGS